MRLALVVLFLLASISSHAEPVQNRLSDWLLEQPFSKENYPLGLSWRVSAEIPGQNERRLEILHSLSGGDPEIKADAAARRRLRDWIGALPATGRVPVAAADARWLEANPLHDPVILPGDGVVLPKRPLTVTVVSASGRLCQARHAAGLMAMSYVKACHPASDSIDWVWMAQPDGKVQRYGAASWNGEKQDEPAPGAWIWAPAGNEGWPGKFSEKLISFLATQGPAPDFNGKTGNSGSGIFDSATVYAAAEPPGTEPSPAEIPVTANDWGAAGVLQTPSARMKKAGDFSVTVSRVYPYTRDNIFAQPFDWLEAGFRYTNISNRLYGPVIAGSQAYKDKSIDLKFRALSESAWLPQLAVGLRDIAGTGLFSGEYVVASKRTGPLDWSLGLGTGNVGARGNLTNPLGARPIVTGTGNFAFGSYFKGPASIFGAVQYQSPWEPLVLKLEYDGNNYQHEALDNNLPQKSPFNFGAVYRLASSVDLSAGFERGNTAMLSLSLHTQLDDIFMPKLNDPARIPVSPDRPAKSPDWAATSRDIKEQTDWCVRSIGQEGDELKVTVDDADVVYWRDYLDRATAVLHRDAPASVDRFAFAYREKGVSVAEHVVDRSAWVARKTRPQTPVEAVDPVMARPPGKLQPETLLYQGDRPAFESSLGMNFNYNIGGPNGFILYQFAPIEKAKLWFRDDTWLQGGVQVGVLDNFNKFTYDAPSNLPRVRTYLREYMTTAKVTMPNLQMTHVGQLSDNQYYSVYGGYLEEMFGGAGFEWLYRPFESPVAVGVDVNAVKQRNFAQDFGFRTYNVGTGHATLYWDTGWENVLANFSAGRYLAGDMGATVQLSRVFQNGVTMGAYFTKTNVTAAQFGEGSFDKGIYISIPFDALLTKSSNLTANFVWKPLTRDGGAKLSRQVALYDLTKGRDARTLRYEPSKLPDAMLIPSEQRVNWAPSLKGIEPYTRVVPKPTAGKWRADSRQFEQRLQEALYRQQFRNIGIVFDAHYRLTVSVSNARIRPDSRAVGWAARTALLNSPLETREIRIVFAEQSDPVVSYDFFDLPRLQRYFNGEIQSEELAGTVDISYRNPSAREDNPLAHLDDFESVPQEKSFSEVFQPDMRPLARVENDFDNAATIVKQSDWLKAGAIGAGMVLMSGFLDKGADRFALNHAQSSWLKGMNTVGNALPWAAVLGTGLAALGPDPRLSRAGYAGVEAGGTAFLAVTGIKYAFGRARPYTGQGSHQFNFMAGSASKGTDGFPSGHAIIAWAVATPFAEEYNAPWLYGAAAVTNLARVGSRQHWVSDTVAGSLLGYGIGKVLWESSVLSKNGGPSFSLNPYGANVSWKFQ